MRLPESVTQVAPDPGRLFIRLSSFQSYQYAAMQRARVAGLGANVVNLTENGAQVFRVMIGPLSTVQQAQQASNDTAGSTTGTVNLTALRSLRATF